jgi:hypothetical protein
MANVALFKCLLSQAPDHRQLFLRYDECIVRVAGTLLLVTAKNPGCRCC